MTIIDDRRTTSATAPMRVVATYAHQSGERRVITFCADQAEIARAKWEAVGAQVVRVERVCAATKAGERWVLVDAEVVAQ